MKFFLFLLSFLLPLSVFAQTGTVADAPVFPHCQEKFMISGPTEIKFNTAQEYSLRVKNEHSTAELPYGKFILTQNGNVVEEFSAERERFVYSFPEAGIYELSVILDPAVHQCTGAIVETIQVFSEKIFYLGSDRQDLYDENLRSQFREKSVLLEVVSANALKNDDALSVWNSLGSADRIIINVSDILRLFSDMEKLQRIKENSFSKTQFFIISSEQRSFLSKVLASSVAKLGINSISLINEQDFNSLLHRWSYEDNRSAMEWETLSYEKTAFVLSMNSALEFLVYAGMSYDFLWFLLVLAFVALIFNILKQVIGLDVFMIYYPMLLAMIISQFGIRFSLAFIMISLLSLGLMRLLSSRIQLLVNARKAVLVSVYVLLVFLTFGIDNFFDLKIFYYTAFESSLSIITIFVILLIVEKIFDNVLVFSRSGMFHIFRYGFVVILAVMIFSYQPLRYFFISFPDVIFAIVITNILVGRYIGLQLAEYIRFSPILKNINEEE